jgi:predicted nucleic acid-binding protein
MASDDARSSVFVDSNVLFSGVHSPHGPPARILALHATGRIALVMSRQVAEELVRNLRHKAPAAVPVLLALFERALPRVAEDPYEDVVDSVTAAGVNSKDAPIVAAALDAGVDYFVTGDRRLRNEMRQINPPFRVLSPRELIQEITND